MADQMDSRVLVISHDLAMKLGAVHVPYLNGQPVELDPQRPTILVFGVRVMAGNPSATWMYWDIYPSLLTEQPHG